MRPPSVFLYKHLLILVITCLGSVAHGQNLELLAEYAIAFIGQKAGSASDQAASLGASEHALGLSKQFSIDVEIRDYTPRLSRGENQVTALARAFTDQVDAIILRPDTDADLGPSLEYASEMQYPIVFLGSAPEKASFLASITVDEVATGRLMAQLLLERLPSNARAAILVNEPITPEINARLQGARSLLGFRRIEKVVSTEPNFEAATSTVHKAEELDVNDQISAWLMLSDWPLQGTPALPWKPGNKPTVAYLNAPTALTFVQMDYVQALVTHPFYEWGQQSTDIIIQQLFKNQAPETTQITSEPEVIDRFNLQTYINTWLSWLK